MQDFLEVLLTVFTPSLGIISILSDNRNKQTGKLTKGAKIRILILALSLLGTFWVTFNKQRRAKEASEAQNKIYQLLLGNTKTTLQKVNDVQIANNTLLNEINRSINPLTPFAVSYSLVFHVNRNSSRSSNQLITLTNRLNEKISSNKSKIKEVPDALIYGDKIGIYKTYYKYPYLLSPKYSDFEEFFNLLKGYNNIEIIGNTLADTFVIKNQALNINEKEAVQKGEFRAQIIPHAKSKEDFQYDINHDTEYGFDVYYSPEEETYEVRYFCDSVKINFNNGYFLSSIDLKDKYFKFSYENLPNGPELKDFKFYFPPNYSKQYPLLISDKGNGNEAKFKIK